MKTFILFIYLTIFFLFSHLSNGLIMTKENCLETYNDCMRPKVLDRAKVSPAWIKQHIKISDLENIFKDSPKSMEAIKKKLNSTNTNKLWDFKIQEKSVKISLDKNKLEETITFKDWKKKCKVDFDNCLSKAIEGPISKQ